ncbi:MAG: hypothetical protein J5874_05810 [Oscillospiraceae bacterium]|nr:hypothetical protein [Oscillospiraceae bacterium]
MVSVKEVSYKNFGKCLSISNEAMEMYITVDIGPRIIKCNLQGRENLMYEDIERKHTHDVSSYYGEGKRWYIIGGHRLWLSPESMPETYYPDNSKVVYTITGDGASFMPPVQDRTGLQYTIEVKMHPTEAKVTVTHHICNAGKTAFKGAAWCLTVTAPGGVIMIPQPKEDTGLLGNRVLALWPYTDMTDPRAFFGRDYVSIRQDEKIDGNIKVGINNTQGKMAIINRGQALIKSYSPQHPDADYPDFGVSTETFANGSFLEAETLSPLKTVKRGEEIVHEERWQLVDGVNKPVFTNESLADTAKQLGW